ncbi:MAG: glycosyltransferase family 2 protein [Rikenellaceae bacterium]
MNILYIIDILLFIIFIINILYLFIFSVASRFRDVKTTPTPKEVKENRIAILIPAYKEDMVIMECVKSCLNQQYSSEKYDIVVISDRMSEETNNTLSSLRLKLINVYFENSTKAKALNYAMEKLDDYDIAVILDADNTIFPDFLSQINNTFVVNGTRIVQAHRCAKNTNTNLAILDAASEEMNNSIYRQGHVNMGLSAALIGSGMAFEYRLFKETMLKIDAIGGFDRALELVLLKDGIKIDYLPFVDVLDEKTQYRDDFSRQRRRWLSAQLHYMKKNIKEIPSAIKSENWDFCDKYFQQISMPRLLLLGFTVIIATSLSFIDFELARKWWSALFIVMVALFIAIPKKLITRHLFFALLEIPITFLIMAGNLFRLKGANKKFIHTKHGVK